jgi:diguanylate cyclase (GGDEF)-like protein
MPNFISILDNVYIKIYYFHMKIYKYAAIPFFLGYLLLVAFPLEMPVWISFLLLAILYFFIIEIEYISYPFSLTGIAFSVQLAGGMSSPLFVSYIPAIFIFNKRGLKLKFWWLILPLFSLFRELHLISYLIFYGTVIFLYGIKPKLLGEKDIVQSKKTKVEVKEMRTEIAGEKDSSATIPNKFHDSLSASLDILVKLFNPYSVVLLIKDDKFDRFQVHVAKGGGEIKTMVSIDKGPLSWYLKNAGVLVNNDFSDASIGLCYYKNEEDIKCFISSSIEYNNKVMGILVVDRIEKIPFGERDKEVITSVVKGLSTLFSLYNHMSVSMLEVFRLRYIRNLTERVTGEIKLEEVRKRIFDTAKDSFKDGWTIFLLKEGNEYHVTEEDGRRYYQNLRKSIIAIYLEKKLSLRKEDLTSETKRPILFPEERDFGAKSLMFSPFKGNVEGGILLLSKNKSSFDEKDLNLLDIITNIASSSVEKAILYEQARYRDGLTGAYNHRFFQEMLEDKIKTAERGEEPITLLMIDFDNFKMINDQFGHQNGDMILREVGKLMKDSIRSSDIFARYGGEEFAIILLKTTSLEGYKLAEKLRSTIEKKQFISTDGLKFNVTISIGVAEFLKHAQNKTDLIDAADRALYLAKREGKNCTIIAED